MIHSLYPQSQAGVDLVFIRARVGEGTEGVNFPLALQIYTLLRRDE